MKKPEPVKQIFEAAGYPCNYNRRNRWFKALAELVDSGLIKFGLCGLGQHWVKEDKKWNIEIRGFGYKRIHFKQGGYIEGKVIIEPYDVLRVAGKFLQDETIKQLVKSHVNLDLSCDRCHGQGYIPMFHYYCDGICFECFGSGYSRHKKIEVKILEIQDTAK